MIRFLRVPGEVLGGIRRHSSGERWSAKMANSGGLTDRTGVENLMARIRFAPLGSGHPDGRRENYLRERMRGLRFSLHKTIYFMGVAYTNRCIQVIHSRC
ncbi:hypothetical protein CEXT_670441 [Caerostris extrusa]|uniref:Uncharacterized protein n=1 Tax=Caerostris extrusa TaxID=172846 RepID=A0AAV4PEU3_CAEEX|nr:hypothetical protein CEXT_670441 [Caerostris extrusa]